MTATITAPVLAHPPAAPDAARLAFHTDVADVPASLDAGDPGFVLVDSRSETAWDQGHVPGAVHLPTARIDERAREVLDPAVPVVVHCWAPAATAPPAPRSPSPGSGSGSRRCWAGSSTGSARATPSRPRTASSGVPADPLTAPAGSGDCGC